MIFSSKLPVPKWQMMQIGPALLPRSNAQTALTYEHAEAMDDLVGGSVYDHYRMKRAPTRNGTWRHSGNYRCCGEPCDCGYAISEIDMIYQSVGRYVPCLFVRDYTIGTPSKDVCYTRPPCVTWAWGWGKVVHVTNPYNVEDYTAPDEVEVSLDGIMEGPLREITYSRWRYGYAMARIAVSEFQMLNADVEVEEAEPKSEWYIPCSLPMLCDPERFWPRDLHKDHAAGEDLFDTSNWDAPQVITMQAPAEQLLRIYGNTAPLVQMVARGDTQLTISNEMGTQSYSFTAAPGSRVYTDSSSGICLEDTVLNVVSPLMGVLDIPVLEPFENHISIQRGFVQFGITPQWIN